MTIKRKINYRLTKAERVFNDLKLIIYKEFGSGAVDEFSNAAECLKTSLHRKPKESEYWTLYLEFTENLKIELQYEEEHCRNLEQMELEAELDREHLLKMEQEAEEELEREYTLSELADKAAEEIDDDNLIVCMLWNLSNDLDLQAEGETN
jgi:hypothetical protein